jgi:hypothetical protein
LSFLFVGGGGAFLFVGCRCDLLTPMMTVILGARTQ